MTNHTEQFRNLHQGPRLLALPNAWDAASARIFESVGAAAIATTSAGVAWSLGYPDGRVMPADVAIAAARRIARVLTVPLSFDVEHGYADAPETVADHIMQLVDAGVAGINIEDGPDAPGVLARKIEAIKNRAAKAGVDIFVNARTDVYLAALVDEAARVPETLQRAAQCRAAGADGLFVPALCKADELRAVADGAGLPLNVMAWPDLPAAEELARLGVRRLSAGAGITQAVWGAARQLATDFLATGQSAPLMDRSMPHGELQGLFRA